MVVGVDEDFLEDDFFFLLFLSPSSFILSSSSSLGDGIKLRRIFGNGFTSIMTGALADVSNGSSAGNGFIKGGLFPRDDGDLDFISVGLDSFFNLAVLLAALLSMMFKARLESVFLSISSNLTTPCSDSFFSSGNLLLSCCCSDDGEEDIGR